MIRTYEQKSVDQGAEAQKKKDKKDHNHGGMRYPGCHHYFGMYEDKDPEGIPR